MFKKVFISSLALGISLGATMGATNINAASSQPQEAITLSQSGTTAVTQSGITMKLKGLVFAVYDNNTGKAITPKNDSPFRYYESDDGQHKILCQGNPEFGQTVIGKYYANYGIVKVTEGSRSGVNLVKVWVNPSAERYTSAYNLKGYTFVTDYLEGL